MLVTDKDIKTLFNGITYLIDSQTEVATEEDVLDIVMETTGIEPIGATFDDGTNAVLTFEDGAVMTFNM